jgi:FtsH-binding integral membrane protein
MRPHYFDNEEEKVRTATADEFGFGPRMSAGALDQSGFATFISQVFGWMFLGLLLTGATSFIVLSSESLLMTVYNWMWPLIILELVMVWGLASMINRISPLTAVLAFFGYAFMNGLTLTIILAAYTQASALNAFMATGATFGVMALYGITTKKDLTHIGSMLMMGLVGLVFTMLFGMIFGMSDIMGIIVSCVAVFIFVGLVAYDTQKLRHMYVDGMENTGTGQKIAIMGALSLYLDFINIFIHLLHLIGDRR